jgi:hypothetical protein
MRTRALLPTLALLTAACGDAALRPEGVAPTCVAPSVARTSWQNPFSRLAVATGEPVHSATDVVVTPGEAFTLEGKLAYGPTSKDLEHEAVTAFLEADPAGCGWLQLSTVLTDSDGRAEVEVPADTLSAPGMYTFRFVVHGDQSEASARVWVVAPGTRAVVFDLDGTLTERDLELVGDVVVFTVGSSSELLFELAGSPLSRSQWLFGLERVVDEPQAHAGAFDVAHHWAAQGYLPIYLSGRPYLFDAITRRWLDAHLPAGPLFLTRSVEESMPSRVTAYKRDALTHLIGALGLERAAARRAVSEGGAQGPRSRGPVRVLELEAAYGNAPTDVCAYAEAGLDPAATFIIGAHGGEACPGYAATQPVGSYPEHLTALAGGGRP